MRRRCLTPRRAHLRLSRSHGAVQALVDEHLSGGANRRLLIWSLLNLENLMEVFASRQNLLDPRATAPPNPNRVA